MRFAALLSLAITGSAAHATVLDVPSTYGAIQSALNKAEAGDIVRIAPGTYDVSAGLVFPFDGVTMQGSTGDPADVVLDGNGAVQPLTTGNRTGMRFESFTLTDAQGGVSLFGSLSMKNCVIDGVDAAGAWGDGAVRIVGGALTLESCVFRGCNYTGAFPQGAALAAFGAAVDMSDCVFEENLGPIDGPGPQQIGGAMLLGVGSSGGGGGLVGTFLNAERCTFAGNRSENGGALWGLNCTATFDRCVFERNLSTYGGALFVFGGDVGNGPEVGTVVATNSVFDRNEVVRLGGSTNGVGAAAGIGSGGYADFDNCTFYANESESIGNAIYTSSGVAFPVTVSNSIFYGHADTDPNFGTLQIDFCIVETPDPMFVDASVSNFRLRRGSPAVDAGRNALYSGPMPPLDLDNNTRFIDDPGVADTGAGSPPLIDMGAYEFQFNACGVADTTTTNTNPGGAFYGVPDGTVDGADLSFFVEAWLAGCP